MTNDKKQTILIVVIYSEEKFKDRKNEYLVMSFYYLNK